MTKKPQRKKVAKKAAPKRKGGRPRHQPTQESRQMVEVLSGFAIPQDKIAEAVRVDRKTLLKHYADEIARGSAVVEAKLVGNLLRLASGSDGTALKAIMFALQCRFGWSQYVPRQEQPNPTPLGKKEAAAILAQTAHEDSDWGGLVH